MASTKVTQRLASQSRIPHFATVEEATEFWATHDSAEFEDEFEDVSDVRMIGLKRDGSLLLWLEPALVAKLTERAAAVGITPARLAKRWLLERLDNVADDSEQS